MIIWPQRILFFYANWPWKLRWWLYFFSCSTYTKFIWLSVSHYTTKLSPHFYVTTWQTFVDSYKPNKCSDWRGCFIIFVRKTCNEKTLPSWFNHLPSTKIYTAICDVCYSMTETDRHFWPRQNKTVTCRFLWI